LITNAECFAQIDLDVITNATITDPSQHDMTTTQATYLMI